MMRRQFNPNQPSPTPFPTTTLPPSQPVDVSTSTSQPSVSTNVSTHANGGGMSNTEAAVISVIVIAVVVLVVSGYLLRGKLQSCWKRRSSPTRTHTRARSSSIGPLTAVQLASATSLPMSATTPTNPAVGGSGTTSTTAATTTEASTRRTERVITRGGRRWGRTGSQRSTTTLPLYSEDPGEEDAVLIRKRESMRSARVSEEGDSEEDDDGSPIEPSISEEHLSAGDAHRSPSLHDSATLSPLPSTTRRLSDVSTARGWAEIPTYDEATSPSLRGGDLTPQEDFSASTPTDGQIPQPRSQFFRGIFNRLGRAERDAGVGDIQMSTSSSSAAAFHNPSEMERGQIMSSRAAGHSLTSLLLHPTTSNVSTSTTITTSGRSSRSSSGTFRRPSFLTTGLPHEQVPALPISAPVPGSLIRTEYLPPKKGFTPDQIKFLTSTDNLGRFGVPVDDPAAQPAAVSRHQRRRSDAPSLTIRTGQDQPPPPTWNDVVEGDRRRSFSEAVAAPMPSAETTQVAITPAEMTEVAITPVAPRGTVHSNIDIEVVPPTPS